MRRSAFYCGSLLALGLPMAAMRAGAQVPYSPSGSFHVQCPNTTLLHPTAITNTGASVLRDATSEPDYNGPQALAVTGNGVPLTYGYNGGTVKCQEISGGDGYMTEADGNQTFMFSFGPLSGLGLIQNGQPGTLFATDFNHPYAVPLLLNGQPNPACTPSTLNASPSCTSVATSAIDPGANGALTDPAAIMDTGVMNGNIPAPLIAVDEDDEFFLNLTNVGMIMRPDLFEQHTVHWHGYPNASSFYDGVPDASLAINIGGTFTYYYLAPDAGTYFWHCHITPPEHLQMGMVGQLFVRPRQNRVPVGNSLYQSAAGCAAVSGVQGGACPLGDAVTGVAGQQSDLRTACNPSADILCSVPLPQAPTGNGGKGTVQGSYAVADPLGRYQAGDRFKYVYNDGDGSTRYDIDVPIQIHGFDPNFHFVGMTFNAEPFSDMKDKYFLLNGRSYPDTIGVAGYAGLAANTQTNANCDPGSTAAQCAQNDGVPQSEAMTQNPNPITNAISSEDSDGYSRPSQPMPTLITLYSTGGPPLCGPSGQSNCGQRASLRIADLDVSEYQTLASLGLPMQLIGFNAKLLRDQAGNNLYQTTNSITLGGGESLDVIIDSTGVPPGTYFLYTPNLDHLSNDAENFGGLMAEVVVK